jgi:lipid-A-disaccharide synthase
MKYYIIAGEASGDLHGADIVTELKKQDERAQIRAWGGDLMRDAGTEIVRHYRDLAFMGFIEVAKNIRTILGNLKFCKADILDFQPDALILIDYPGFNLRIAQWASQQAIPVMYYISPQIWAWNVKRVHKIKKSVDRMFTILPFEAGFYQQYDYDVTYVGHPLKRVIDQYQKDHPTLDPSNIIALLPGSRKQEIAKMLPVFSKLPAQFPDFQFHIAKAPAVELSFYQQFLPSMPSNLVFSKEGTYNLLSKSFAAITTSGTATLETALFHVPQIVCYKGNALSYQIAKRLIRVPYISLVNLIANKEVVKELIQQEFHLSNLILELQNITSGPERIQQLIDYKKIHQLLAYEGSPPELVVNDIIDYLQKMKINQNDRS